MAVFVLGSINIVSAADESVTPSSPAVTDTTTQSAPIMKDDKSLLPTTKTNKKQKNRRKKMSAEAEADKKTEINITCIQNAIDKRDTAIIVSVDTYLSKIKTAFETRRSELKAAWALAEKKERGMAIKDAWTNFKEKKLTARKDVDDGRKQAWNDFNAERKNCGLSDGEGNKSSGLDKL